MTPTAAFPRCVRGCECPVPAYTRRMLDVGLRTLKPLGIGFGCRESDAHSHGTGFGQIHGMGLSVARLRI